MQLEDGHTGILIYIRKKFRRTTGEAEAQQLKAASGTDAKVSSQYSHISAQVSQAASSTNAKVPALRASLPLTCALVHTCALAHLSTSLLTRSRTDAKVLAGAISSFAREGRRMCITAIGAGAINQVRKTLTLALYLTLHPDSILSIPLTLS